MSKPNLQNTPIRSDIGRKVRKAFVETLSIFDADYAEVEERILASMDRRDAPGWFDDDYEPSN